MNKKPVREIKITNRSVSGYVPGIGRYESSLERDMFEKLRYDDFVESVLPQPLSIHYIDSIGKKRKYTPDGLITFKSNSDQTPILYEIKFRQDFRADWRNLLPKFRAAKKHCTFTDYEFKIYTENEIRTPYLQNIKFLWPFKNRSFSPSQIEQILQILSDLDETDVNLLLFSLARDKQNRAEIIPCVWYLISHNKIGCDISIPLNMNTPIWSVGAIK